jgi:hypothetical protein
MPQPKIEVVPYLYGSKLYVSVTVDGVEQEFESDIVQLATMTAEFIDPYDIEQENEAYAMIHAFEEAACIFNDAVGADEGAIQYE